MKANNFFESFATVDCNGESSPGISPTLLSGQRATQWRQIVSFNLPLTNLAGAAQNKTFCVSFLADVFVSDNQQAMDTSWLSAYLALGLVWWDQSQIVIKIDTISDKFSVRKCWAKQWWQKRLQYAISHKSQYPICTLSTTFCISVYHMGTYSTISCLTNMQHCRHYRLTTTVNIFVYFGSDYSSVQ